MGRGWRMKAKYLQNTANTVFAQCARTEGFNFHIETEINLMWGDDYPQELWTRVRPRILTHLDFDNSFGHESLGRIIGSGHPDYSDEGWLYAGDVLPIIEVGMNDRTLVYLAASTLVAAKINYMRNKRP